MSELVVTSNVGRDLLQAAQHFRTDRAVVWEYVVNSLQYTDENTAPRVVVSIDERGKQITITDNGRGMSMADLEHFFTMHGENPERAAGRLGRGLFGTGKSAALGIGDEIRVTTVKSGARSSVRLHRSAVESMPDGSPVPVEVIEREAPTGEPNGTVVQIRNIHLRRIDRSGIIAYIERNLSHYPRDVEVHVDHHQCEFREPDVAETHTFNAEGDLRQLLGEVTLVVRVARGPLQDELRGINVFSHGNWHETTLAGCEGKPMSEYLFGEIDVVAIEEYQGAIAPFDNTRSGHLNPNNEVVAALYRFIGPKLDGVRRELVGRERKRAQSEEARRLADQASKLSEVLSEDFASFRMQLRKVRSVTSGRDVGKRYEPLADDGDGPWSEGGESLATQINEQPRGDSEATGQGGGASPPEFEKPVVPDGDGDTTGRPTGTEVGEGGARRSPRGGMSVDYRHLGEREPRGKYTLDARQIVINLDHPQVAAGLKLGGAHTSTFLRLAAEIATAEYAVALATELSETYTIADEAIYDIHDAVDRISRRFEFLYIEA